MKNHWLLERKRKTESFWTAEFSDRVIFSLKPRRVEITDPTVLYKSTAQGSLQTAVIFADAVTNTTDHELLDFMFNCPRKMTNWIARLRRYHNLFDEAEVFELSDLRYSNIRTTANVNDLEVVFQYNNVQHYVYL